MQILTYILFILVCSVSIFWVGVYFPYIPLIWEYASIVSSFFSMHSVIISYSLWAVSLIFMINNSNYFTTIIVWISLIWCILWTYPVYSLYKLAGKNDITLSAKNNIFLKVNRWAPVQENSIKYVTREWKDLYLDYYPSKIKSAKISKPLAYIHGWWFTWWNRSEEPDWIDFFTSEWFDVFDIWYTLANDSTPTWDVAGREIQTALSWIDKNSDKYEVNSSQLVVAGSSAGWSLAMQAVYGWAESFPPYGNYSVAKVNKVVSLFPALDLWNLWKKNTSFYGIRSRDTEYVWWTPSEFPERYEYINILNLAWKNSPETLIIHGSSDTLIPVRTISPLLKKLDGLWVKNTFLPIPYAQHWFTYFSSSFGFQISAWVIKNFLSN